MALPNAGVPLSLNDIHIEVGGTTGTQVSLDDADVRSLVGTAPGTNVSVSDFYGTAYNEFAALIGPSDTGDSFLYGYQTLNTSNNTVLGSEGLHTFNGMRASGKADVQALTDNGLSYKAINGWKRDNNVWTANEDLSGYDMTATAWHQAATGLTTNTGQVSIIEYRIYTDTTATGTTGGDARAHNGVGLSWGSSTFSDNTKRARMFSFSFNTTDVNRGRIGKTNFPVSPSDATWSDKNNISARRTSGRSTVTMMTIDTSAGGGKNVYYSNNGGTVQAATSGNTHTLEQTPTGWWIHVIANPEFRINNHPGAFQNTGFQQSLNQGFLYVDRIVSTSELAAVSNWLYNSSGVPNHTDATTYTDGTF